MFLITSDAFNTIVYYTSLVFFLFNPLRGGIVESYMGIKDKKIVLVTGATSGIGRKVAEKFAQGEANLILPVRNQEEGDLLRSEMLSMFPQSEVTVFLCDLASLASVRNFVNEVQARYAKLDILVNNAGVFPQERIVSADGYELNFAVNYLAPVLLSRGLLPLLKKSTNARIVNVASSMYREGKLDFEDLQGINFDRYKAYAQSKLALVVFTKTFAKEIGGTGVMVNAVHPGVIKTKLSMGPLQFTNKILRAIFMLKMGKPEEGAWRIIHLAVSSEVEGVNGEYFEKNKIIPIPEDIVNSSMMTRLSAETEKLLLTK